MAPSKIYQPRYVDSRALVIGIDRYKSAPPLAQACNDALGIADALTGRFGFEPGKIELLTDEDATRTKILASFMRFATTQVEPDSRIIIYFAGHGHTVTGYRGETGFLVPVDGRVDDLSTMIRWDELTRNADLIPAKHILFIMDACYGGLALSRKPLPPGSMRFVRDMLQRFSRQVLTAGKADEAVADAGGPRAGHSIFTGHVLDAMEGAAATVEGIISANGIMAYVYDKVGNDANSYQTPHYGFIDGDGDFIFNTAPLDSLGDEEKEGKDLLITIPTGLTGSSAGHETIVDALKRLIPDQRDQIKLDDLVSGSVRRTVDALRLERFPVQGEPFNNQTFPNRIKQFEDVLVDVQAITILLARWAAPEQLPLVEKVLARLAEAEKGSGGNVGWLRASWYPLVYLMYSGGIAALSAERFEVLRSILTCRIQGDDQTGTRSSPLVFRAMGEVIEISEAFKAIPGHEQYYAPRSEYFFRTLQPNLEDLLFVGKSYEMLFDRFEILLALVFADIRAVEGNERVWGPPGRFGWKQRRGFGSNPFDELVAEAESLGNHWGPLRVGLFGGSIERFRKIVAGYRELLKELHWW
jgi:Caspase domain